MVLPGDVEPDDFDEDEAIEDMRDPRAPDAIACFEACIEVIRKHTGPDAGATYGSLPRKLDMLLAQRAGPRVDDPTYVPCSRCDENEHLVSEATKRDKKRLERIEVALRLINMGHTDEAVAVLEGAD